MKTVLFGVVLTLSVIGSQARAQCTKDLECKGNRVCIDGKCVQPKAGTYTIMPQTPPPAVTPSPVVTLTPADPGWSRGAAVYGFIAGGAVLSLAVGAELNTDDKEISVPLGAAATLMLTISGPIVSAGASSARSNPAVRGSLACRIIGWVTYGLAIANATGTIILGVYDITPPDGLPTILGVLGLASLANFSIDALIGASQASNLHSGGGGVAISPYFAPVNLPDGDTITTFGLVGSF